MIKSSKMASGKTISDTIVNENLAVFTFNDEINEPAFRRYFIKNWKTLTFRLNEGSTILFIAGIHGKDSGELGSIENIQTLKNQVRFIVTKSLSA